MADVNRLRAEARRLHANATKKVSRMKRINGIAISGTDLDPRKPRAEINSMTSRQLTAYHAKLQKFNARTTGYVPSEGGAIPRSQWSEYKRLEARHNKRVQVYEAMTKDIGLPGQDMTIGQRRATMPADRVKAFSTATNKPLTRFERQSKGINGPKALQKLIAQMNGKLTPDYVQNTVKEQRKQYERMLEIIGDQELIEKSKQMTDGQFNLAWNEGKLADSTVSRYVVADVEIGGASGRIEDDSNDDSHRWVDWALTLKA
jgi:hypothetical protein